MDNGFFDKFIDTKFKSIAKDAIFTVFHLAYLDDGYVTPEQFQKIKLQLTNMLIVLYKVLYRLGKKKEADSSFMVDLDCKNINGYVDNIVQKILWEIKKNAEESEKDKP